MTQFLIFTLAILFILAGCVENTLTPNDDVLEVPRMSIEELKSKLDQKADVIVVEARSEESFGEGHIKGAISMPLGEVEARYEELPRDTEIVLY